MPKGASANLYCLRAVAVLVVLTQHFCRRMQAEHIAWGPTTSLLYPGLEKPMIQAGIRLAARLREKPDTVVAVAA